MAIIQLDLQDFQVEIDEEGDVKLINKNTEQVYGLIYRDELETIYEEIQEMRT